MTAAAAELPVVDGLTLPAPVRALLRPGELAADRAGRRHRLPRFFYEVRSWSQAKEFPLTAHLRLSELLVVDRGEAPLLLEQFPHYVPCAVVLLARALEELRGKAGGAIHVAANGGYRSPAHRLCADAVSPHNWAAAADIYRIGDTPLNTQSAIEKYGAMARELGADIRTLPFGRQPGETDDHLHLDLGYALLVPAGCDETENSG